MTSTAAMIQSMVAIESSFSVTTSPTPPAVDYASPRHVHAADLDKELYPDGTTKGDVLAYYRDVSYCHTCGAGRSP